jgi:hypothetical protein
VGSGEWVGDLREQVRARAHLLGGGTSLWALRCVLVDVVEDRRHLVRVALHTASMTVTGTLVPADEFYATLARATTDEVLSAVLGRFATTPPPRPDRGFPQFDPKHVHTAYLQSVILTRAGTAQELDHLEVALEHVVAWGVQTS